MGRPPYYERDGLKRGPWTPDEDKKLIDYISKHGQGNWRTLPKNAGLERCGKSCRLRWTNYLRPDIKRGRFSSEEEDAIIHLHSMLGNKWAIIASMLPGRTDNEIKNYWNTHIRKRLVMARMACVDPVTYAPLVQAFEMAFGAGGGGCMRLDHNYSLMPTARKQPDHFVPSVSLGGYSGGGAEASGQLLSDVNHHELLRLTTTNAGGGQNSADHRLPLQQTAAGLHQQQRLQQQVQTPLLSRNGPHDEVKHFVQNSPNSMSTPGHMMSTPIIGTTSNMSLPAHEKQYLDQLVSYSTDMSLPELGSGDPKILPFNFPGCNINIHDGITSNATPAGCNSDWSSFTDTDSILFNHLSSTYPNKTCNTTTTNNYPSNQSPALAVSRTPDLSLGSQLDVAPSTTASCTTFLNSTATEDERDSLSSVGVKEGASLEMINSMPGLLDPWFTEWAV